MECVVYKRRIVLVGIASAAILASGVLTAGTALAIATPLPAKFSAGPVMPGSPMSQVPGVVGALQAADGSLSRDGAPMSTAMSKFGGAMSKVNGVTGAVQGLYPANLAGDGSKTTQGGAIGQGIIGGMGNTLPSAGSVPGLSNATGAVNTMTGNLGSAVGDIPALGGLTGAAPGLSQAAQVLGAGS
jgi:hypothetical protein